MRGKTGLEKGDPGLKKKKKSLAERLLIQLAHESVAW